MEEKFICKKCGLPKLSSEFFNNQIKKNGKDSTCKTCRKLRSKNWRSDNKEHLNQTLRDKYAKKKASDPEFQQKTWYWRNREKALLTKSIYQSKNRKILTDYLKEYRFKNKNSLRKKRASRYELINGIVFRILGDKCCICGESNKSVLVIDHINEDGNFERLSKGSFQIRRDIATGKSDVSKYQVLCRNCNAKKFITNPFSLQRLKPIVGKLKICSSCHKELDESLFHAWRYLDDGMQSSYFECASCRALLRKGIRNKCFSFLGGLCIKCGESDFDKLSIDHIFDDGQIRRNTFGERTGVGLYNNILNGSLVKTDFQILCHNCNYLKKATRLTETTILFNFDSISISRSNGSIDFLNEFHYAGFGRNATVSYAGHIDNLKVIECKFSPVVRLEVASSLGFEPSSVLELDRFCIRPSYHRKNFGSFFLSKVINLIRIDFPNIRCLVSFSDPRYGHSGGLYRASNWKFDRETKSSYVYRDDDGNEINKKTLYEIAKSSGFRESEYASFVGLTKIKIPSKSKFIYLL